MRRSRWLAGIVIVTAAVVSFLFAPILEFERMTSPDGAFTAVVRTQPAQSFIPRMPGGGSDKPARVTVYKGGQSCGSAWLELAWMARELAWELESRPRRARLKLVAEWNLDDCTVAPA